MSATAPPDTNADWGYQVARALHRQEHLLRCLVRSEDFQAQARTHVAVGASRRFDTLDEWLPGVRRIIAPDRSQGIDSLPLTSGTPARVLTSSGGRIGGSIINTGSNPVILYLAGVSDITASTAGRAAVYLAASGGSWDLRISDALWCGHVSAIAQGGNTTLCVAEI